MSVIFHWDVLSATLMTSMQALFNPLHLPYELTKADPLTHAFSTASWSVSNSILYPVAACHYLLPKLPSTHPAHHLLKAQNAVPTLLVLPTPLTHLNIYSKTITQVGLEG
jgi:hypothetical protein